MTIYFNAARQRWMYDFRRKGMRYAGYCVDATGGPVTSKNAARQSEGVEKRRVDLRPKIARGNDLTMAQVFAALAPHWRRQSDWRNKRRYMAELLEHFGPATPVKTIGENAIQDYIAAALAKPVRIWTGGPLKDDESLVGDRPLKATGNRTRGAATVNLYLHMLRQVLSRAAKIRDPITGEPVLRDAPAVPILPVSKRHARPVPEDVLSSALAVLPEHVADGVRLTLYFGFRQSEVFRLRIHHVDFAAGGVRLYADEVKDDEDAFMPGAPAAMAELQHLVDQARTRGTDYLITYRNRAGTKKNGEWSPIKSPKTAWAKAMAGIEARTGRRWRWHDIRAAYITHVALTSGPVAAQALARHSDYKTTRGYIDVADEIRRQGANSAAERPALRIAK